MTAPLTCVDLFAGAGGLSLGLQRAGFRVLRAIDHHEAAVATYRHNLGDHVVKAEIEADTELPAASVIVGGPPCQGFSSAGLRRTGDRRNTLVSVFAELIVRNRPRAFVFENVEGFLTAEGGDRVLDLLAPLVRAGYRIHLRKINAANYGVAQHRKRVLGIGGLGFDPTFPEMTHRAVGVPGARLAAQHLPLAPSVLDAIGGLPPPALALPGEPQGHVTLAVEDIDLARIKALRPGQTMRDLAPGFWQESFHKRAFRRVQDGTAPERRGGAPFGIRRLVGHEPCKAITRASRADLVHPELDRCLTQRECARIQGFPDTFVFLGAVAEQAHLIGNAVPPLLGEIVGRSLARDLATATVGRLPGAVLSFVPTLSAGSSPALRHTVTRVRGAFATADPAGS